ncbi:hypothetical protein HGRIS_007215 [Hohenbuehelia grisea]|uniref:Uncharacterized protein n=1 Tax=Hohenbuehelia grisea TaxID=104357 RepID=A0ABR3JBE7_9AGAR
MKLSVSYVLASILLVVSVKALPTSDTEDAAAFGVPARVYGGTGAWIPRNVAADEVRRRPRVFGLGKKLTKIFIRPRPRPNRPSKRPTKGRSRPIPTVPAPTVVADTTAPEATAAANNDSTPSDAAADATSTDAAADPASTDAAGDA